MIGDDGMIGVTCEFCSVKRIFDPADYGNRARRDAFERAVFPYCWRKWAPPSKARCEELLATPAPSPANSRGPRG